MPDRLTTRTATRADLPALAALINQAFKVETFLEGPRTSVEQLESMMAAGQFLVLDDPASGTLAGSVYARLRDGRGYFGMLAVALPQQNAGLGRLLVDAAEDYCRRNGCAHIDISVLSLRPELPPLYHKFGYRENGTKEFDPAPQKLKPGLECCCIVMSKAL